MFSTSELNDHPELLKLFEQLKVQTQCKPCLALKAERERHGLSQVQLAVLLQNAGYTNINGSIICKFETGKQKPWRSARVLLCNVLKLSEGDLFPEL